MGITQILEKEGRLPDAVIACVGGGSNAIGMFADFIDETSVGLIGVEPAGHGIETGEHGAPLKHGRVGVYFGMKAPMMQTDEGQIEEYVSLYALGGAARVKADGHTTWVNGGDNYTQRDSISEKSTSFAYGAGVQFNPTPELAIGVGYEGTTADLGDDYGINGWNLTVGYRF
jgi:hypothetical protein